eukprot:TRINITY_DN12352_c0_g1_i1.p1 TRINITY_DN12352_c0_g1~~TRINITY_DN12352_c0_g1_i1.p1  ORF type:complete len:590 (+),score=152.23 TRINITY_DN12352_c0_g1_i1:53-1822(+)
MADTEQQGESGNYDQAWEEYYKKHGYPQGHEHYQPQMYEGTYYPENTYFNQPYGGYSSGYGSSYHSNSRSTQQPTRTVWVGSIEMGTTEQELLHHFSPFGNVLSVKILHHKNCAFIKYPDVASAMQAHSGMQGRMIRGQVIKLGWGKPDNEPQNDNGPPPCKNLWLGNIDPGCSEDEIRRMFERYGQVLKVRVLPHKNCAFVNFENLEQALKAKDRMQGVMFRGQNLKVNFGKLTEKEEQPQNALIHFQNYGPPQPPAPLDPERLNIIDKMAEMVIKTGPPFENMVRKKQRNNVKFGFLNVGGDYNNYYRWKIFDLRRAKNRKDQGLDEYGRPLEEEDDELPPWLQDSNSELVVSDTSFKNLSSQERDEINQILDTLEATKESIRVGKDWIMERPQQALAIAQLITRRISQAQIFQEKLNIVYLVNDVLHHSTKNRSHPGETDTFCEAFKPSLARMLKSAYEGQTPELQDRILNLLDIWKTKMTFDLVTIEDIREQILGRQGYSQGSNSLDNFLASSKSNFEDRRDNRSRDYRGGRDRDNHGRGYRGGREDYRDRRGGDEYRNDRDDYRKRKRSRSPRGGYDSRRPRFH